jgi:hypothetical protein
MVSALHRPAPRPRFPEVTVPMTGCDGHALAVLGRAARAAHEAGLPHKLVVAFLEEARAGDRDQLLATVARWFSVE